MKTRFQIILALTIVILSTGAVVVYSLRGRRTGSC